MGLKCKYPATRWNYPFRTGEEPKSFPSLCFKSRIHKTYQEKKNNPKGQRGFLCPELICTSEKNTNKQKECDETAAAPRLELPLTMVMVLSKLLPEVSASLSPSSADRLSPASSSLAEIIQARYSWRTGDILSQTLNKAALCRCSPEQKVVTNSSEAALDEEHSFTVAASATERAESTSYRRTPTASAWTFTLDPASANVLQVSERSASSSVLERCARYGSEPLSEPSNAATWPLKPGGVKAAVFSGEKGREVSAKWGCSSNKSRRAVSWDKTQHRGRMNVPLW